VKLSEELRRETRVLAIALAALLAGTALALLFWIRGTRPANLGWLWVQMGMSASVPGKYVIFSGLTRTSPMGPVGLSVLCVAVESAQAQAQALFLGPLGRLRWIGPWLSHAHLRARAVMDEYPRLKRMAFLGVVFFVYLPLPGTGAVGGMFAGQIVGLSRPLSVLAVSLGTTLIAISFGAIALTLGAEGERLLRSPWFAAATLIAFVLFLAFAYGAAKRKLREP
jgi:uncharacterized membrane protein